MRATASALGTLLLAALPVGVATAQDPVHDHPIGDSTVRELIERIELTLCEIDDLFAESKPAARSRAKSSPGEILEETLLRGRLVIEDINRLLEKNENT